MPTLPLPIQTDGPGIAPGVAVVRLEQPGRPVVVIDAELLDRLDAALDLLPNGALGVVIASASDRVFVAGADLRAIIDLDDAALDAYLKKGQRVFGRIAALGVPTAAAIAGAALGGGLELAMHCDGLIGAPGAKPYPLGLPEASLGICPGWGGTALLGARINPVEALRRTASGATMTFPEAVELGLFDRVCGPGEGVVAAAGAWVLARHARPDDAEPARWIGRPGVRTGAGAALAALNVELRATGPGRAVGECAAAGLDRGWRGALDAERRHLVALRRTPEARAAIEAFFARSGAKAGKG